MRLDLRSKSALLLLVVAPALLLGGWAPTRQPPMCSNRTLDGTYAFVINGSFVGFGPIAAVGLTIADGNGNFTARETESVNGTIVHPRVAGTYVVNRDCTGSATMTDDSGTVAHMDFVLSDDGRNVDMVQTDPGAIVLSKGVRQ